jgi:hypothetical protein
MLHGAGERNAGIRAAFLITKAARRHVGVYFCFFPRPYVSVVKSYYFVTGAEAVDCLATIMSLILS